MKKTSVLGVILLALGTLNAPALTITNLAVLGATNDSGNILVRANVLGGQAHLMFDASTANGFGKRYFSPTAAVGGSWSNSSWDPYITGTFVVNVTAFGQGGSNATASTTVTVTRVTYGTINSIKYSSLPYNANGVWSNVDTTQVKLNDLGTVSDATGVGTLKCNLLNATVTPTPGMGEEARDMAYCDTSGYKPAGTPYRFELVLHARPRNYMGMGEIKRWVWTPDDTNNPTGRGTLTVDLTSTSPWRSTYSNALQSHVGFNCKFAPSNSDMPTGTIMCTSAHYQDVRPTNASSGTAAGMRIGMYVNGHTGTNSYLKTFLSDDFLHQQYQITNTQQATNLLAGFIQHFNTNDAPVDSLTSVNAQFTRVEGGTNIVYDYNYDGVGDAGFEMMFYFEFHSAVAAQIGIRTSVLADPAIVDSAGNWYVWFSGSGYQRGGPWNLGASGTPVAADFDGDLYGDPAVVINGVWYVWFTSQGYQRGGPWSLGVSGGTPVAADFDGDLYADPAVVINGDWYVWFTSQGYQMGGPWSLGVTGLPVAADYDGDLYADPAVVDSAGNWRVWFTGQGYRMSGPFGLGIIGTPVPADFDGR